MWASHFGLVDTWIPQIIHYLDSGDWRNGPVILGNTEGLHKRSNKHLGRESLKKLIAAGMYDRKQLMEALLAAHPEVPKSAFATLLTDTKNPSMKYSPFDRRVVIDANGIWSFEE